jgi:tRNA U38,U39,U40 pseudouridine synthase TruA
MAVTVIRDKQPLAVMKAYMVPEKKLSNLQLAPGEGLFLRECLFKYYNEKATEPINWEPIRDKLDNFRNQVIIPHLATKEINDNMFAWS